VLALRARRARRDVLQAGRVRVRLPAARARLRDSGGCGVRGWGAATRRSSAVPAVHLISPSPAPQPPAPQPLLK
jgi:hypothetical protein